MKDINTFLSNLIQGSSHIIANPKTTEELIRRGVKFDTKKPKTQEEYLKELFKKRIKESRALIGKLPSTPNIAVPTIQFLYDEIRECILFGLFGSAISLSAILLEFSLKQAIVRNKSGVFDKKEWDRLENIELGTVISEVKKLKIINEEEEVALKSFKNTIRNPYLHYNLKKIVKNIGVKKVKTLDINTMKVKEMDLDATDNPITWGFAKRFVDKEIVFDVFNFVDRIVNQVFKL